MKRRRAQQVVVGRGRVTLRHIADEAGLSLMMVSRALRGRSGEVAEDKRTLIRTVAERLGYRPNLVVRALRTGRTGTIGVIAAPFDAFSYEVMTGLHDGLAAAGLVTLIHWPSAADQAADPGVVVSRLLDRHVDGVVVMCHRGMGMEADWLKDVRLASVRERGRPLVTIAGAPAGMRCAGVAADERRGADLAARHLLELGHRHCAVLAIDRGHHSHADRGNAFRNAITGAGGSCSSLDLMGSPDAWMLAINRLLTVSPRPTGIFLTDDLIAPVFFTVARKRRLMVPRDLSVIGWGDGETAAIVYPPLTTVQVDGQAMGRMAAGLLVDQLGTGGDATARKRLRPELVIRASTASVRR